MTGPNKNPRGGMYGALCLGGCGRVTRDQTQSATDFPGTRIHRSGGRCGSCQNLLTGVTKRQIRKPEYVHAELSVYTPEQTKRVTALFGRDVEIMRMLGMTR